MSGTDPRRWEMDELVEMARGALVGARGSRFEVVDPPPAVLEAGEPHQLPWSEQLANHHVNDRGAIADLWGRCVDQPGECLTATVRRRFDGTWSETEVRYLNLLHQDDVGCVLILSKRVRDIDEPDHEVHAGDAVYAAPHVVVQHLDEVGTILRSEGDLEGIFGRTADQLAGRPIMEHIHPADLSIAVGMWVELVQDPDTTRTIRLRFCRADGATVWVLSTVINRLEDDGSILTVTHDITDLRAQEAGLRANEEELRFLTEEVPVAVFRTDDELAFTFMNARCHELLAGADDVDECVDQLHPDDRTEFRNACQEALDDGSSVRLEVRTDADERVLAFRLRGVGDPRLSTPAGLIGTVEDVTIAARATAALRLHAERDPLTELANRRALTQVLADALADGQAPVVLFGDLDDFKRVNDERGHDAGDALLQAIGRRIRQAVRPSDVVGRWGGDEFVVVCRDVAAGGEDDLRVRLHRAFDEPIAFDGWTYEPSISLGAVRARGDETAEDVLKRADSAMYEAKRKRHRR